MFAKREWFCLGEEADPERRKALLSGVAGKQVPATLITTVNKYCRDTSDPTRFLGISWPALARSDRWLMTEYFCQSTRHITEPGSALAGFFRVTDSPGFKRLHDQSLSLCDDLRAGKLSVGEANYRWKQEVQWWSNGLKPEFAKDFRAGVEKAFGVLWGLLAKQ